MKVAIIGSGRLARAASEQLTHRGVSVQLHSRSTGFDVLDPAAPDSVGDIEAVIEATDIQTQKASVAAEFFVRSTRAINALAARSGARHILVSIVGCQHPDLQGNGSCAGKAAQERVAESGHAGLTIVRSKSTSCIGLATHPTTGMPPGPAGHPVGSADPVHHGHHHDPAGHGARGIRTPRAPGLSATRGAPGWH